MIQKADIESTTFEKFWQAVQQTYANGTYRVGPLLQVCILLFCFFYTLNLLCHNVNFILLFSLLER